MVNIGMMAVMGAMLASLWPEEPLMDQDAVREAKIRQEVDFHLMHDGLIGLRSGEFITDITAVGDAADWSFNDLRAFRFHADFIGQNYDLVRTAELAGSVSLFYGLGGRLKLRDSATGMISSRSEDAQLGVRVPVGLSYSFKDNPLELFAEVVPLLDIKPEQEPGIGIGIGARYSFSMR